MEHEVSEFLINSWAAILTLMLTVYVALDGFDLGIGVLSLLERDKSRQILMMDGLSGVWDANETWLVLIGGTLFGAFPLAYAAVLQALYIPVLLMLFALVFRGVAFEFRLYAKRQEIWLFSFGAGSLLAALGQGLTLGALLSGMRLPDTSTEVEIFSWWTPFAILTALLLVNLYTMLGASYLLNKVDGSFQKDIYRQAWTSTLTYLVLLPIYCYRMALEMPEVLHRWVSEPVWFGVLGACIGAALLMMIRGLLKQRERSPFFWCMAGLIMAIIGLFASFYPYLIPGSMTLHKAASSTRTLEFMLTAVGGLLPLMLAYNAYQYYVFRGRIKLDH